MLQHGARAAQKSRRKAKVVPQNQMGFFDLVEQQTALW
jgi:hypothetical protein